MQISATTPRNVRIYVFCLMFTYPSRCCLLSDALAYVSVMYCMCMCSSITITIFYSYLYYNNFNEFAFITYTVGCSSSAAAFDVLNLRDLGQISWRPYRTSWCKWLDAMAECDSVWLCRLEKPVRLILESFGSSFIRMIGFRDVWAFVGQKGIRGFSPLEEVERHNSHSILQWIIQNYTKLK